MAENPKETSSLPREPGMAWRLLAHRDSGDLAIENEGILDEVVLDDWFHLERMQENLWWLRVGDARLLVELQEDGVAVSVERGFYEEIAEVPGASEGRDRG